MDVLNVGQVYILIQPVIVREKEGMEGGKEKREKGKQ